MSVTHYYGWAIQQVENRLKVGPLGPLLVELTKVCSDEEKDAAYLWECMNGTVENPSPVDAQRALVMHWVGYIFGKLHNEQVLAPLFPHQSTMGVTREDAMAFDYQVEVLRHMLISNGTIPDIPQLVRQDNNVVEINAKLVNQKVKKRKRGERANTDAIGYTQSKCVVPRRRSKRLAAMKKKTISESSPLTFDDVVSGC